MSMHYVEQLQLNNDLLVGIIVFLGIFIGLFGMKFIFDRIKWYVGFVRYSRNL